jgi:hypothetical protein
MASTDKELRREIGEQRAKLADEVKTLRTVFSEATDVRGKLRANLPVATAGALGLGFVVSGGIGATIRLLLRR